jgi:hypothetical protein
MDFSDFRSLINENTENSYENIWKSTSLKIKECLNLINDEVFDGWGEIKRYKNKNYPLPSWSLNFYSRSTYRIRVDLIPEEHTVELLVLGQSPLNKDFHRVDQGNQNRLFKPRSI